MIQPLGFGFQHLQVFRRLFAARFRLLQKVHVSDDGCERGSKVVGHVGNQLRLHPLAAHFRRHRFLLRLGNGIHLLRQPFEFAVSFQVNSIGEVPRCRRMDSLLHLIVLSVVLREEEDDQQKCHNQSRRRAGKEDQQDQSNEQLSVEVLTAQPSQDGPGEQGFVLQVSNQSEQASHSDARHQSRGQNHQRHNCSGGNPGGIPKKVHMVSLQNHAGVQGFGTVPGKDFHRKLPIEVG